MSTVVITGGCGFLGRNLITELIITNQVSRIVVIDNFVTSDKISFLKFVSKNRYVNIVDVIEGDICDMQIMNLVKQVYTVVDDIYHMASLASPKYYKRYPLETLDVGYIGTKHILDLCVHYAKTKPCRMLFTSTSEVYGDALQHPQKESYYGNVNTVGERSCYDESKRVSESLIYTYTRTYGIDVKIARIFNTYGPHMDIDDGRIVTEIAKAFFLGTPLHIFGDGTQTRSLNYVDDTVKMLVKLMKSDCKDPVNVGNEKEVDINTLVDIAKNVFLQQFDERGIDVVYTQIDKDDPKVRRPCLEYNKQVLGTTQITPITTGIASTFLYFHEVLVTKE
jgi:UDP-glucuronate decarboxylase